MKRSLVAFILFRLTNHKKDSVFWMYLIFIICGLGAAGIWSTCAPALIALDSSKFEIINFASAMYTFFPSLLVTSCVDILLPDKVSRPVRMLSIILLVFSPLWMILCANLTAIASSLASFCGCAVAVLTWVVAHGEDPSFSDELGSPNSPTGGTDTKPVSGSEGGYAI